MKRLFVLAILLAGLMNVNAYAQNEAQANSDEVTEEELEKFAAMEDSVMAFYESKNEELVDMIKNNETIEGAGRYNEIKAAWGDEEKMEAANVTDEEKEAYQEILDFMEELAKEVRELKTNIIMDKDQLGAATYNKINKAMKEDPEMKEKVDTKIAEKKEERESRAGEDSDATDAE